MLSFLLVVEEFLVLTTMAAPIVESDTESVADEAPTAKAAVAEAEDVTKKEKDEGADEEDNEEDDDDEEEVFVFPTVTLRYEAHVVTQLRR